MMGISITHMIVLAGIVLLLFGTRGKISETMRDLGQGLRALRDGVSGAGEVEKQLTAEQRIEQKRIEDLREREKIS